MNPASCFTGCHLPGRSRDPSTGLAPFGRAGGQLEVTLGRWGTRVGHPVGTGWLVTHAEPPCSAPPFAI